MQQQQEEEPDPWSWWLWSSGVGRVQQAPCDSILQLDSHSEKLACCYITAEQPCITISMCRHVTSASICCRNV